MGLDLDSEKTQLQDLNNRFASYIETVHFLQQENQRLALELDLNGSKPENFTNIYEEEVNMLREEVEGLTNDKATIKQENSRLKEELKQVKLRLDDQICKTEDVEEKLQEFIENADAAELGKMQLEINVKKLEGQINFLKKVHEEEVSRLRAQIQDAVGTIQVDKTRPDLSSNLRDLRGQLDAIIANNTNQAIERYKHKVADLKLKLEKKTEALGKVTKQSMDYLMENQKYTIEIKTLKKTIKTVEEEKEEVVRSQYESLCVLREENIAMKEKTTQDQHDYEELLNIKASLDAEIATYRMLLEGEESRVSNPSEPYLSTPRDSEGSKEPVPFSLVRLFD